MPLRLDEACGAVRRKTGYSVRRRSGDVHATAWLQVLDFSEIKSAHRGPGNNCISK